MAVKRLARSFVVLSLLVIGALTAYHHYVDGKTPSSAALDAATEYERGVSTIASVAVDVVRNRTKS
ncbi:hypothetical protein [Halanaeroarchaeum sulfurireducens]|uniref:Uncharacterized protein n=1 Tax=Halanaeroarchaeum sulfurireducens TaxID=1604004 RepID=A0A0F7PCX5_9EURY|nr:hypothetical protein [Halanaeroarchaeum sulfurireducens]AKH97489.1 hypothetical protein HLASF_1000 [Halanaeroarchaeum sulfurireducens]ALG81885.1 hypothetical protein HLASA_0989 [Halanaeroarchaeum sulfurireducens]